MERRRARAALHVMNDHDDDILERATDRFERRLSDECGTLRAETAALRGDMNKEFGGLRADLNQRLGDLRADMEQGFGGLRADMTQGLGDLRADLNRRIGDLRADMIERTAELIKWNAAFWVAQLAAMAALLVLIR